MVSGLGNRLKIKITRRENRFRSSLGLWNLVLARGKFRRVNLLGLASWITPGQVRRQSETQPQVQDGNY